MARALILMVLAATATAQRCDPTALSIGAMNAACCNGGHRRRTQTGTCFLTTCTAACAQLYVPFYTQCSRSPNSQLSLIPNADRFHLTCLAAQGGGVPPPPTPGPPVTVYVVTPDGAQCGESTFPAAWQAAASTWATTSGMGIEPGTCASAGYSVAVPGPSGSQTVTGTGAPSAVVVTFYTRGGITPTPPPPASGSCQQDSDCSTTEFCRADDNSYPPTSSSCVSMSPAGASCGGMMAPSAQTRCMTGMQCVQDNGPMPQLDAGGHCYQPCATGEQRDGWGNCVPASCQTWFDGCAECTTVGGRLNCAGPGGTGEMCHSHNQNGPAGCHDLSDTRSGVCTQTSTPSPTCSRMICPNVGATTQAGCMAGRMGQCCTWSAAATPPPPALAGCTSSLSCEALTTAYDGWPVASATAVCGESDNGFAVVSFGGLHQHTGATQCYGADDTETDGWDHAQAICFEIGARLCTQQELVAGAGLNTGCGHNAAPIWTADSCTVSGTTTAGHTTVNPATHAAVCEHTLAGLTAVLPAVRCCADTAASKTNLDVQNGHCDAYTHSTACTSPRSCNELAAVSGSGSWPTQSGDVMVCGESDQGLGPNHTSHCYGAAGATGTDAIGWVQAHTICANAGARMCTVDELEADETRGTGCSHDRAMVWTGEAGHCAAGEHMTVIGAGGGTSRRRNCVSDSGSAAVRCCADAVTATATACGTTTASAPAPPPTGSTSTIYVITAPSGVPTCGESTFPTAWMGQAAAYAVVQGLTVRPGTCASAGYTNPVAGSSGTQTLSGVPVPAGSPQPTVQLYTM
jgi:hypothetical protein